MVFSIISSLNIFNFLKVNNNKILFFQGSGTYAVEAVLQTSTPRTGGRLLILANGAYGKRMETMCKGKCQREGLRDRNPTNK